MFPAIAVKPADNPARIAILKLKFFEEQMRTETTAVKKVIIKFTGRRIL